jgi:4-amino-4-deoxy-L-arabinose transferase-like glycosyltransferase
MPLLKAPRFQLPPSPAALAAIALAFVLPGLAGHDPWKSHDALGIGVVWEMAFSGDPIVPRIADLVWLGNPPFYHWLAAALGWLLQPLFEFHIGARLASGVFMLAALWLLHVAARDWSLGEERSAVTSAGAPLLLLGSVGLIVHAHEAVPELPALTALCAALAVLAHAGRRPLPAGIVFGAALGFGFLSSSWIPPAALGVAVLAAHFVCDEWRTRKALPFLLPAILVAATIAASWPLALYLRSGDLFHAWWKISMQPHGAVLANLKYFLVTASWFAWPAWPLALWAGWALRGRWRDPRVFVPAVAVVLMLAGLACWGPTLDVDLIPLLAPLAFLASQGIPTLRRGAAAALDWFAVVTFACCAVLVWLGYLAMLTGTPPRIAANLARAAPGFEAHFQLLPLAAAAALTLGWIYLVFFTAPAPIRSVLRWAAGIVLLWGTVAMLWMPWVDYQKSYRSVALKLRASIPPGSGCIAAKSVGVPQQAALHYHAGIRTRPYDPLKPRACPLLIVQGSPQHEMDAPGESWVKLADVGRPGDRAETQRLYRLKK